MDKHTQKFFAALLIAPLFYILVGDYKSAFITSISIFIGFLIWYYQDKIRGNWKLMQFLRKFF